MPFQDVNLLIIRMYSKFYNVTYIFLSNNVSTLEKFEIYCKILITVEEDENIKESSAMQI